MQQIDGPHIINLDHRTDRWEQVQAEFTRLGPSLYGTPQRHSGTYTPGDGSTGCLMSHIAVLSAALARARDGGKPIWVCEDDIAFLEDAATVNGYIDAFLRNDTADVLCLGFANYKSVAFDDLFDRTLDCQTTSCYIIKPTAAAALCRLWTSVLDCRINPCKKPHPDEELYKTLPIHHPDFYWVDQSWKLLQQCCTFVIPKRRCVLQRESFSDIEGRVVNYRC